MKPPVTWRDSYPSKRVEDLVEGDTYLYFGGPRTIMKLMESPPGSFKFAVGVLGKHQPRYWGIHRFIAGDEVMLP